MECVNDTFYSLLKPKVYIFTEEVLFLTKNVRLFLLFLPNNYLPTPLAAISAFCITSTNHLMASCCV